MANSDYLIAGNDEHGLEPLPTVGHSYSPPEKSLFTCFLYKTMYYFNNIKTFV